ncbi:MAG TPA: hypothetical protein VGF24_01215 [Vicinamibacterales bacterium]|jgi:hypothetical protein
MARVLRTQRGMQKNDEEKRIEELKHQAEQIGMAATWDSGELSPQEREFFWQNLVAFETAPVTTLTQQLRHAGCHSPEPESMTDDQLTVTLREVIDALARLRVFLEYTDHLSDRDLYARLWRHELPQDIPLLPFDPRGAWRLQLTGSGSEEDTDAYLRYYADEEVRRQWLADFPDYVMPPHEELPYDRDRHLPVPE